MDSKKEASQLDGDDIGRSAHARILDTMSGSDFVLTVTRAKTELAGSLEALDDMVIWVTRLAPYFDFDPEMTVGQALQLYLKDRPRRMQRKSAEPASD